MNKNDIQQQELQATDLGHAYTEWSGMRHVSGSPTLP